MRRRRPVWGRMVLCGAAGGVLGGLAISMARPGNDCLVVAPGSAEAMVLDEKEKARILRAEIEELKQQVALLNKINSGREGGQ